MLVTAVSEATGEVKYFVSNAIEESLERILPVAFRRATIEHAFRVAKQEAGLMHYEGRDYTGLMRHMILSLIVLSFVSVHTDRLWGKNPEVTREQVCRALNVRCRMLFRRRRGVAVMPHTSEVIVYHQQRNATASKSHKKRRPKCVL